MNTTKTTYEELEKRLAEAKEVIRTLQDRLANEDITERKLVEEEIQKQVAFLDSVMEQSLFAMWISDAEGMVVRTNSALRKILNLTDEQISGKYNVLRDDNLVEQGVMNQVRAVYEEQKPAKFTIPWIGVKTGDADFEGAPALWIDVSIFPIVDTEGRLTNAVCHWIDITKRKQKEHELRMSEKKYKDLVENMVDVIFALDITGHVVSVNASVKAMLGYTPDEIIGRHFTEWVHPDQKSVIVSVFERILAGETIIDESLFVDKDGKEHTIEFHATRITSDGQIVSVQGILRDITEQRKAAESLKKNDALLKEAQRAAHIGHWELDPDVGTPVWSEEVFHIFGRDPSEGEFSFMESEKHVHPDEWPALYEAVSKASEKGTPFDVSFRIVRLDGENRWLHVIGTPIISEEGKVIKLFGTAQDITDYKRAQEEIESLSKFPSENPNPVLRVHRDGTILYSNAAALSLLAELGAEVGRVVPARWRCLIDEAFESRAMQCREEEIHDIIYSFVIAPFVDGEYVNLYARDITDRKNAEADLRKSEERFKQVVENAGDWVWEVDSEGLYTYVNPVVERVLGYKPEDIVGQRHFYDFLALDVKDDLTKAAFETFAKRESFKGFVNPNVHKNGNTVIVETSGSPIIDEKGHFFGYRGVDRDITEQTQREEELRKLNADLVLASRTAGTAEVATDVLHNVGNVLNSINISARFIEDKITNSKAENLKKVVDLLSEHTGDLGTFLTENARGKHIPIYLAEVTRFLLGEQKVISEKLQSLTKNVGHVKQIIKAQQGYARSGGAVALMQIDEVIEDAMEINYAALKQYGIELHCELAELPRIHTDKQRVLQILVNLITNAKQALAESEQTRKVLTIRSYKHGGDALRIEVADNGIGILKENMPRIFKHGFTTKKNGHGFGLHSSALAAREMGGSLTVHSDGTGHGARFTLELPLKSEAVTKGSR